MPTTKGSWIKGISTNFPKMEATLGLEVGCLTPGYQTPMPGVAVSGMGFVVGIQRIGTLQSNDLSGAGSDLADYGPVLRPAYVPDPLPEPWLPSFTAWRIYVQVPYPPPPNMEVDYGSPTPAPWDTSPPMGANYAYFFIGEGYEFGTYWVEGEATIFGSMLRLWTRWGATYPDDEQLKYWWQCFLEDGWLPEPGEWGQASFTLAGQTVSARYRYTEYSGEPSPYISYSVTLDAGDTYIYMPGRRASVDIRPAGEAVDDPDYVENFDELLASGTSQQGSSETRVQGTMPGTVEVNVIGQNGIYWVNTTWIKTRYLPAVLDGAGLEAYNLPRNDNQTTERTDVVVRIARASDLPEVVESIASLRQRSQNGQLILAKAGHGVAVTTDETWAKANDEYAESGNLNNLPWKLDCHPPALHIEDTPYWQGPVLLRKWTYGSLRTTGQRFLAPAGTNSPPNSLSADSPVEAELARKWERKRWTFSSSLEASWPYPPATSNRLKLTTTAAGTHFAKRTIFSYWLERQSAVGLEGAIAPPDCYRITKANYYWPQEPRYDANDGRDPDDTPSTMTQPEDIYWWAGWRYLLLQLISNRTFDLTVTVTYITVAPQDNHLTGQERIDAYTCTISAPQTFRAKLRVQASAAKKNYLLDLWKLPANSIVQELKFEWDAEPGHEFYIVNVGLTQDMPAEYLEDFRPVADHNWLKWMCRHDGTEMMLSGRADDTPSLRVLDQYRIHIEDDEVPYIEWLYGAQTGTDLSHAMTLSQFLTLVHRSEGFSAQWDEDAWKAKTAYTDSQGQEHVLSPGYPWDVRFEVFKTDVSTNVWVTPHCTIGVRRRYVAGGAKYKLYGRWYCRGRLDGIMTDGGDNVLRIQGCLEFIQRYDSQQINMGQDTADAHGSWWSPPLPEQLWRNNQIVAPVYLVRPCGTTIAVLTSSVGLNEWIWLGPAGAVLGYILALARVGPNALALLHTTATTSQLYLIQDAHATNATPKPWATLEHGTGLSSPTLLPTIRELGIYVVDNGRLCFIPRIGISHPEAVLGMNFEKAQIAAGPTGSVVVASLDSDGNLKAYLWHKDRPLKDLGTIASALPDQVPGIAVDASNAIHVVFVDASGNLKHAIMERPGAWTVLDMGV